MGVEFDLVSDNAREGYELGKGPWYDDKFANALRSADPVAAVSAFLIENDFETPYADRIAREVVAFAATHPDWRVIDDCSGEDIAVVDDAERAALVAEGEDPDDKDFPIYRRVGSRHDEPETSAEVAPGAPETDVAETLAALRPANQKALAVAQKRFRTSLLFEVEAPPGETVEVRVTKAHLIDGARVARVIDPVEVGLFRANVFETTATGDELEISRVVIVLDDGKDRSRDVDQLAGSPAAGISFRMFSQSFGGGFRMFSQSFGFRMFSQSFGGGVCMDNCLPVDLRVFVRNPTEAFIKTTLVIHGVSLPVEEGRS